MRWPNPGFLVLAVLALASVASAQAPAPTTSALDFASLIENERAAQPPRSQTLLARSGKTSCCVFCKKGIPCGNSCISASKTCRKGPGCAC